MSGVRDRLYSVLCAAAKCAFVAALIGCHTAARTKEAPRTPITLAAMPPVAPISYFERSCANCHGSFGMFYGETFAAGLDDAALVRVVGQMVRGPAQSTLDPLSMEALTAFHRSLRDRPKRPFVAVTSTSGGKLRGEVSPGSSVVVLVGDQSVRANVDGFEWTAALPAEWEIARRIRIRAMGDTPDASSEIEASRQSFSHHP